MAPRLTWLQRTRTAILPWVCWPVSALSALGASASSYGLGRGSAASLLARVAAAGARARRLGVRSRRAQIPGRIRQRPVPPRGARRGGRPRAVAADWLAVLESGDCRRRTRLG